MDLVGRIARGLAGKDQVSAGYYRDILLLMPSHCCWYIGPWEIWIPFWNMTTPSDEYHGISLMISEHWCQVMARCRQVVNKPITGSVSPGTMSTYGVTRPQWVKSLQPMWSQIYLRVKLGLNELNFILQIFLNCNIFTSHNNEIDFTVVGDFVLTRSI